MTAGTPYASRYGNPWLFNGRAWDAELGLYHYRNRYLDPVQGRFTTRDPIGIWGDPMNLGNGYSYVGNNPGAFVDPFGLESYDYPQSTLGWAGYYAGELGLGALTVPGLAIDAMGSVVNSIFGGGVIRGSDRLDLDAFEANRQWAPNLQGEIAASVQDTSNRLRNLTEISAIGIYGPAGVAIEAGSAGIDLSQGNYLGAALPFTAVGLRLCPAARRAANRINEGTGEFEDYFRLAYELDVSTAQNGAVFYSGPGNRELAEAFAAEHGRVTLEMTPGGRWLHQQALFGPDSPLKPEEALAVWAKISHRYASEASGYAVGFAEGASPRSIFNEVEYPALLANPNITNVFTGGH